MNKTELLYKCNLYLTNAIKSKKIKLPPPICEIPQRWFVSNKLINTAICITHTEGNAGLITQAWGIVFVNVDKPIRCTEIHTSFYTDESCLNKLLKELIQFNE